MAFATTDDLEARLGRDLTASELARADALLDDVTAAVVNYTGQTFTLETTTTRLKVRYGVVRLPQRPVVSVDAVKNVTGSDVAYTWDTRDRLDLPGCGNALNAFEIEPYRIAPGYVDVTYEHGYTVVPADILGIVCNIALRNLGQDPTDAATVSETVDGYTYRLNAATGGGSFGILGAEMAALDRYRRQGGTMTLAGR